MTLLIYILDQILLSIIILLVLYFFIIIKVLPQALAYLIFLKKKHITCQYLLEWYIHDF